MAILVHAGLWQCFLERVSCDTQKSLALVRRTMAAGCFHFKISSVVSSSLATVMPAPHVAPPKATANRIVCSSSSPLQFGAATADLTMSGSPSHGGSCCCSSSSHCCFFLDSSTGSLIWSTPISLSTAMWDLTKRTLRGFQKSIKAFVSKSKVFLKIPVSAAWACCQQQLPAQPIETRPFACWQPT